MSNPKVGHVSGPERLKVNCLTNLSPAVHLRCETLELWQTELWCGRRIRDWDLKLKRELVANLLVVIPALSVPASACLIALDVEPVLVIVLVDFHVLLVKAGRKRLVRCDCTTHT